MLLFAFGVVFLARQRNIAESRRLGMLVSVRMSILALYHSLSLTLNNNNKKEPCFAFLTEPTQQQTGNFAEMTTMTSAVFSGKSTTSCTSGWRGAKNIRTKTQMNKAGIPSNKTASPDGGLTSFKFSEERLFRVVDTEVQKVSVVKGSALKMHPQG